MGIKQDIQQALHPYKDHIQDVISFVLSYLKNPVEAMRRLPNWPWPTLGIFFALVAAAFGVLGGLFSLRIIQVFLGFFIFPILAIGGALFVSGFFYYTFIFFYKNEIELKVIATTVVFASLPLLALNTLSMHIPPVTLVGGAITSLLLVVGFSESTHIPKNKIVRLIVALYLIQILFYISSMIGFQPKKTRIMDTSTPDAMEVLRKEFGQ